jgi:hypothetical protein
VTNTFHCYSRKTCPVCKVHRTYEGIICPPCSKNYEILSNGRIRRKDVAIESFRIQLSKPKTESLTIRIDSQLKHQTEQILRKRTNAKRKIGWTELIEACLKRYCTEEEK